MSSKKKKKKSMPNVQFYLNDGLTAIWKAIWKNPKYLNQQDAFRTIIREKAQELGLDVDKIVRKTITDTEDNQEWSPCLCG